MVFGYVGPVLIFIKRKITQLIIFSNSYSVAMAHFLWRIYIRTQHTLYTSITLFYYSIGLIKVWKLYMFITEQLNIHNYSYIFVMIVLLSSWLGRWGVSLPYLLCVGLSLKRYVKNALNAFKFGTTDQSFRTKALKPKNKYSGKPYTCVYLSMLGTP